jgi:hypothetical protein
VRPVSEGFLTGSSRLFLRWTDPEWTRRFDLEGSAATTGYGSQVEGGDLDLRLGGAYRQRFSNRWALDTAVSGWRSRRGSSGSLLDFNLVRASARLAWTPGNRWVVTAGIIPAFLDFPERFVTGDSTRSEWQRQVDLSAGALYRFPGDRFLGAEVVRRRTSSNQDRSRYQGPVINLRAGTPLPAGISLILSASYAHRGYDQAPVITQDTGGLLDTLGVRRDNGWLFTASFERKVNRRAKVFFDATYLHQVSNDDFYAFNQARFGVGVTVALAAPSSLRPGEVPLQRPGPLAPLETEEGMRFRYRAPEARSVALVGGFNGWDTSRSPLVGPNGDGIWETVLPLAAGVWRYAFVVDGRWVAPPDAPRYEDDGFGGRNGVISVR